MNAALQEAFDAHNGVLRRQQALQVATRSAIAHAFAKKEILRPYPTIYADAQADEPERVAFRAALRFAGDDAALSHISALRRWRLPVPETLTDLHVATSAAEPHRTAPGVVVHRWRGFTGDPPLVVVRDELPVVSLDRSLVDAWPWLPGGHERRAPVIVALRERRTTVARISRALAMAPHLEGRAELRHLLDAVAAGCHSELEIWGYEHVFDTPELAGARRQVPVQGPNGVIYLDVAIDDVMVNFELDGRMYHSSPEQRERDMARDSWVAGAGWLPIRYSHNRLTYETDAVRREAVAIVATRRRQLGIAA